MKIMFSIPSLGKGGAERVISNLSNYMIKNNEVYILLNTKKDMAYNLNDGIKIIELDGVYYKNSIYRNFKRLGNTKKIINNINPDVVISFLPMPSFRVLFLKRGLKCKVIVSDRNNPQIEYKHIINKILMKWLYPRADGIIFQTNEQKEYFNKKIKSKSVIIPNPLKEEFLDNKYTKRENTIINVGRLVSQKNQKLLIDAFNEVSEIFPQYKIKIFGEGNLKEQLQGYIDSLNLNNKVFLCGVYDNIREELLKSKVFILTSNYEGMPNSLIEAMACGLPCISTDCPCGGPKELITDGVNGLLFDVNNKEMLKIKLIALLNDEKLQHKLSENAAKIIYTLNPKIINNKWLKYIKEIVNNEK